MNSQHKKTIALLLDFDGVISPVLPRNTTMENSITIRLGAFPCVIPYHIIDMMHEIDTEELDTQWISSWSDITETFAMDSLGAIPHFDWVKDMHTGKTEKVHRYLTEHPNIRTLIVADDDEAEVLSISAMVENHFPHVTLHTFSPQIDAGLTREECASIKKIVMSASTQDSPLQAT